MFPLIPIIKGAVIGVGAGLNISPMRRLLLREYLTLGDLARGILLGGIVGTTLG